MSADGLPPGSVRKHMFGFANAVIGDGEIVVTPYTYSHVQLHHVAMCRHCKPEAMPTHAVVFPLHAGGQCMVFLAVHAGTGELASLYFTGLTSFVVSFLMSFQI